MVMLEKLEKLCEDLGHGILVHEHAEGNWHVSVQGEHGTVAHAHGKSKDDAAAKVLELLQPAKKPAKAVPKKQTKPAKIVATKANKSATDGAA
jgi:predicted RNase H-like HicB family nuclease